MSDADTFAPHYVHKERAARIAALSALSTDSPIGAMSSTTARTLSYTHVEPHLACGYEVALDVRNDSLKTLEDHPHGDNQAGSSRQP
ncbi:hypothetical protein LXA43DRAFT_366989 [Ganoderma leucocontextum]|nr:hypothetical protein LXA43DRAFT_366989 [Ganoderma leucocontextum]